jgi:tripartite-type tricarboxylate transporter receptor subunit TctC
MSAPAKNPAMTGAPRIALALAALVLTAAPSTAQEWPTRPVRIVSTFAAGGTADILARVIAEHLSTAFKQQFFVEVRAGASGTIGVKSVVDTPPDGYNFVITTSTLLVLLPASNPKLGYDPTRDLTNIAYIAGTPIVLVVGGNSGIKTLKDFVERGKSSPTPLTYSSSGIGSSGHLAAEYFAQKAGIRIDHVPYKGASQALTDLVGGHIVFAAQTSGSVASMLRAGTLVGVAHTAKQRLSDFADIPTFKEQGYDFDSYTWFSLSGPAGLPGDIVTKLNGEIGRILAKPEIVARLGKDGLIPEPPMSVARFKTFIGEESARWTPVLKQVGLAGN